MKHLTEKELLNKLKNSSQENLMLMKELKQVSMRLQKSEKVKSQFLSNIRNEINNPFAAIMGLSQTILDMKPGDDKNIKKVASMIFSEAFKLDYQLKNIFAAAEIEAGEVSPEVKKVDIEKLIGEVIERFTHKAGEKQLEIRFYKEQVDKNKKTASLLFSTDGDKLELILSNLLGNAIEFSAVKSVIQISKFQFEKGISIIVEDHGIGIDPSDQEIIFDRFVQIDQGHDKNFQGHGLGLPVVKSYLEILNGDLNVESFKNGGSKFSLFLPPIELSGGEGFQMSEDGIFL